ncbi:hypothetical protein TNCV_2276611 [Trichonephila clavipes]|nr:hypothetical protein TNCV_2276611 [Trichonephila clavipes]
MIFESLLLIAGGRGFEEETDRILESLQDLENPNAFGDEPRPFDPWLRDENDTSAGTHCPNYSTKGRTLSLDRFNVPRSPTRWVFNGTRRTVELMTRR